MPEMRFVYGFEYEEHAVAFRAAAEDAGYRAALDERDDGMEAVSIVGHGDDEERLDALAMPFLGYSLGARPAG